MKGHVILFIVSIVMVSTTFALAQSTLSLNEFLRQVELNHPTLRSADFEPELAEADVRSAMGGFDPLLNISYLYKDRDGKDKLNLFDGSLELPIDMLFSPKVKATYNRERGTSVNPETSTSTGGEGTIGVSLPLFQGIFTDNRRNQLRKALLRPDLAKAQYQIERNNVLRSAGLRYWDWSEALAAVEVADSLLDLAQLRFDFIRKRARAGESALFDTVEVLQEVQRRLGERFRALRIAEQLAVDVAVYLWNGDGSPQQNVNSIPTALPLITDTVVRAIDAAEQARLLRPEIRRAEVFRQTSRMDSSLAREFLRPLVELEAALVAYDVTALNNTDYKLGLKVSQPLFFRQASAKAQSADITVQRADLTLSLVERMVVADAVNAVIALDRSRERLQAAGEEVRLARLMVNAENRRFEAGESTLLQLNIRERFLSEGLLRLVSAQAEWVRARLALQWATGTI